MTGGDLIDHDHNLIATVMWQSSASSSIEP
jgi:hypothetical protein